MNICWGTPFTNIWDIPVPSRLYCHTHCWPWWSSPLKRWTKLRSDLRCHEPHTHYTLLRAWYQAACTAWSMISSCLAAQSCLFLLGYSCWAHKPHTHYTFNFGWYHAAWLLIRESLQGQENSGQVKPLKPRPMSLAVTWDAHKDPALMLVYTRTWIGRLLILLLILSCVQSLLFFRWVDGKRLLAVWSCGKLLLI